MGDNHDNDLQQRAFRRGMDQQNRVLDAGTLNFPAIFLELAEAEDGLDEDGFRQVGTGCLSAFLRISLGKALQPIPAGVRASAVMDPRLDKIFEESVIQPSVLSSQTFKYFDVDQDGVVSTGDLEIRLREIKANEWSPLHPFVDVNGDGQYTPADYGALMLAGFTTASQYAHELLDSLFEAILVDSPIIKNCVNLLIMFYSGDGKTLTVEHLSSMVPEIISRSIVDFFVMATHAFIQWDNSFANIQDTLEAKLPEKSEDGRVTLQDFQEVFSEALIEEVRALQMGEALNMARDVRGQDSIEVQIFEGLKEFAPEVVEKFSMAVCVGLFHFIDVEGADVVQLDRALQLLSIFKRLKNLENVSELPNMVLTHLFSLINEEGDKLDREQCEDAMSALLETLRGLIHIVLEMFASIFGRKLFAEDGGITKEVWHFMTRGNAMGPVEASTFPEIYTLRSWGELIQRCTESGKK